MTTLDIYPASSATLEPAPGWRRFGWRKALALHLGPAAVTFAAALAIAPLLGWLGLPRDFSLTIAFAFVLTPIELWLLLRAAHRATGRWSLRALPAVLAFRRPMGRWWLLVPVLFGLAVIIAVALTPVGNTAGGWLSGVYPHWLLPSYNSTAGFSRWILVPTLLATLAIGGVASPMAPPGELATVNYARSPVPHLCGRSRALRKLPVDGVGLAGYPGYRNQLHLARPGSG